MPGAPSPGGGVLLLALASTAEEAAEAQRLRGLRRRKERTVAGAYEVEGLATAAEVRRLVEIAVLDTLALENSIARSHTLSYLAQTALRVHQAQQVEASLEADGRDGLAALARAIDNMTVPLDGDG